MGLAMFLTCCSPMSSKRTPGVSAPGAPGRRYADSARFGRGFEAGRDVDTVARDVVALDDDVAEVDSHAKRDAMIGREVLIA